VSVLSPDSPLVSIVVPVRGRARELVCLLESFLREKVSLDELDAEIIVVDDGSAVSLENVVHPYASRIRLRYFRTRAEGRSNARNFGAAQSASEFLLFLDSDCEVPAGFFSRLKRVLDQEAPEFWGGPDRAHAGHSLFSQAVAYSMNSLLTSGGLRGAPKRLARYYPRGMNFGISRQLFETLGGFREMVGEDIEVGLRLEMHGIRAQFFEDLFVFHRHRSNAKDFFKKTFEAGFSKSEIFRATKGRGLQALHFLPLLALLALGLFTSIKGGVLAGIAAFFGFILLAGIARGTGLVWRAALRVPFVFLLQLTGFAMGFVLGFAGLLIPFLRIRIHQSLGYTTRQSPSETGIIRGVRAEGYDKKAQAWIGNHIFSDFTRSHLPSGLGLKILDLMCGTGIALEDCAASYKQSKSEIVAIDASEEMLFLARKRAQGLELAVRFIQADLRKGIPLESAEIDVAIVRMGFHHLKDKQSVVQELHRVLRPEGRLLVIDKCYAWKFQDIAFGLWRFLSRGDLGFLDHHVVGLEHMRELLEKNFVLENFETFSKIPGYWGFYFTALCKRRSD